LPMSVSPKITQNHHYSKAVSLMGWPIPPTP
jgi:hypothetical protein